MRKRHVNMPSQSLNTFQNSYHYYIVTYLTVRSFAKQIISSETLHLTDIRRTWFWRSVLRRTAIMQLQTSQMDARTAHS